ncbi:MAG: hypothetical protein IPI93_08100 [Sphingobacteriaceae bacterium]|nr:hypothetical protein [Sphingobacteriaceae bacterium]
MKAKEEKEKLAAEKDAAKKKAAEEKLAADKAAKEKADADAKAKAEADKLAAEKAEKDKQNTITPTDPGPDDPNNVDRGDSKYKIPAAIGANKYKETIKRADDLFKMKRWAEAKPAYEEALKYKAGDPYATSKLETVEKMIKK